MNWILAKILYEKDLDTWSKLKAQFFSSPYNKIFSVISKFYDKHGKLPTFDELEVSVRNKRTLSSIKALKEVEIPDVENEIVYEALINEYAQSKTLDRLDTFITDITLKDSTEIVDNLNRIAIEIEEETENQEQIMLMNNFMTVDAKELQSRVPLGLNNDFDTFSLGAALTDFYMFGGFRGTGKSVICSNIACNQYEIGNTSLYFSIEMRGREIYERNLSILTGVPTKKLKSGNLSNEDKSAIAEVRARMTEDGSTDLLEEFYKDYDLHNFESKLMQRPLSNTRLITIDNPELSLMHIDAIVGKYKNVYQDKLTVVIVDYINQVAEKDAYDWKVQSKIAKKLKAIARNNEVVMVSPYQADEQGNVKFAKSLLIPPDWAFNMEAKKLEQGHERDALKFTCLKSRGDKWFNFESEINWDTLRISPAVNYYSLEKTQEIKKPVKKTDDL
jgi:replicative DNA helicase